MPTATRPFFSGLLRVSPHVFSVGARPMRFRDQHMRNAHTATKEPVSVASNALLIKRAGPNHNLTILCDSGPGLQLPPAAREKLGIPDEDILLNNLARHGIGPGDIDIYCPSHLHWDHTGWAFEGGHFKLPKAHVIMSQQARQDNARATTEGDASFLPEVSNILDSLAAEGRLTLLDAGASPLQGEGTTVPMLGDGIRFFFSRGHSDGQMHAVIATVHGVIVFGGDFWPTAWHAENPSRFMPQFDRRDLEQLLRDKAEFLPRIAAHGAYVLFYHDPITVAAQVILDGAVYRIQNPLSEIQWAAGP